MPLNTVEVEETELLKGVVYPRGVRFREIVVTGPPSSGKSTLVAQLGGWPEEGYIDLAQNYWWRNRVLTFRPREVHFGFPFRGLPESMTVFNPAWLAVFAPIDYRRIHMPPAKNWFFEFDWRARYIYDFQLPSPGQLYKIRKQRSAATTHPVDKMLSEEIVERQSAVYEQLALHFQRSGLRVIVRTEFGGKPRTIVDAGAA